MFGLVNWWERHTAVLHDARDARGGGKGREGNVLRKEKGCVRKGLNKKEKSINFRTEDCSDPVETLIDSAAVFGPE